MHTPTPWELFERDSKWVVSAKRNSVATTISRHEDGERAVADAAHIVLCVNAHEALVAACEAALADVCYAETRNPTATLQKLRAALALAGKGYNGQAALPSSPSAPDAPSSTG